MFALSLWRRFTCKNIDDGSSIKQSKCSANKLSVIKNVCCFPRTNKASRLYQRVHLMSCINRRRLCLSAALRLLLIQLRTCGQHTDWASSPADTEVVQIVYEIMGMLLKASYADFGGELSWTHYINCEEPFSYIDI